MSKRVFEWKRTELIKPTATGEEYIVYNQCDGYRVAEWLEIDDEFGFYEFGCTHPLPLSVVELWCMLPSVDEMINLS